MAKHDFNRSAEDVFNRFIAKLDSGHGYDRISGPKTEITSLDLTDFGAAEDESGELWATIAVNACCQDRWDDSINQAIGFFTMKKYEIEEILNRLELGEYELPGEIREMAVKDLHNIITILERHATICRLGGPSRETAAEAATQVRLMRQAPLVAQAMKYLGEDEGDDPALLAKARAYLGRRRDP